MCLESILFSYLFICFVEKDNLSLIKALEIWYFLIV